jgi:hypothetical protein
MLYWLKGAMFFIPEQANLKREREVLQQGLCSKQFISRNQIC